MKIKIIQNKKYELINLIYIFILFLFPLPVYAQGESVDVVLGRFLNRTVESLVFNPIQSIYIFRNDIGNAGRTIISNPFKNLRPIGPLEFIQIPSRVLVDFSNYVFEEVGK